DASRATGLPSLHREVDAEGSLESGKLRVVLARDVVSAHRRHDVRTAVAEMPLVPEPVVGLGGLNAPPVVGNLVPRSIRCASLEGTPRWSELARQPRMQRTHHEANHLRRVVADEMRRVAHEK